MSDQEPNAWAFQHPDRDTQAPSPIPYQPENLYPPSMEDPAQVGTASVDEWVTRFYSRFGRRPPPPSVIAAGGSSRAAGPNFRPDSIASYFGTDYLPQADADGNVTDPDFDPLNPDTGGLHAWPPRGAGALYTSPEIRNLTALLQQGGGVRGAMQVLIDMQWSEPETVIAIQMELMQHGFFGTDGTPVDLGRVDTPTAQALTTMITGARQSYGDESFDDYMLHKREVFQQASLDSMVGELEAFDKQAADDLKRLRDSIEQMDLSIELSDPVGLNQDIQAEAVATIGRRLKQSEVDGLIGNIHQKERDDYYANSLEYQAYQAALRNLQYATTTIAENREGVINGNMPADLDQFMMAIEAQESGGDPAAVNPDSGAFGKYQFMPETWRQEAALAGLNPADRSEENQDLMARHMAARYFNMFGSWFSVAQAWYAGPASKAIQGGSVGDASQGGYPTINTYAEEILQRMVNGGQLDVDQAYAAADAGSLGGATASEQGLGPDELTAWWDSRQQASADLVTEDGAGGLATDPNSYLNAPFNAPTVGETTGFDMQAYMQQQVEREGGVDTDAFRFAQNAQSWYDALGAR